MRHFKSKYLVPSLLGISSSLFTLNAHATDEQPADDEEKIVVNDQRIAADCKKIPSEDAASGQEAYVKGDYENARDAFINQVGWSEFCALPDSAIATAYNNVAMTYIKQKDFLKAEIWLMLDEKDKKSKYNLGLIKNELNKLPKSKSPIGEYWTYAGRGLWNVVGIAPKNGQYQIEYFGMFMGVDSLYYGPAGLGQFSMLSPLKNGKAAYRGDGNDCLIRIQVKAAWVEMEEKESCGFGLNVSATGRYYKVSNQYQLRNLDDY